MTVTLLVGNPKPRSRTYEAGLLVGEMLTGAPPDQVIDVVDLGAGLLAWGDPAVEAAVAQVRASRVLIVASPTYKATYTGLLKLFLDQMPPLALDGIVAFPLMMGAGMAHALAPELHLKPVLVELGASCPAPGLYLLEKTFAEDERLAAWCARAKATLPAAR